MALWVLFQGSWGIQKVLGSASLFPESLIQEIHDNLESGDEIEKTLSVMRSLFRLHIGPYTQDNFNVHNLAFSTPVMKVLLRQQAQEGVTKGDDILGILSFLCQLPVITLDVTEDSTGPGNPVNFFRRITICFPGEVENPAALYLQNSGDLPALRNQFEVSTYAIPEDADTDDAIRQVILTDGGRIGDDDGWSSNAYYLSDWAHLWKQGELLFFIRHHTAQSLLWVCYNDNGDGFFQVHDENGA
ncbi:MAG: hypothetical protein LW808_002485 [Verrucomicrobiota bacterium]|nr:MAG: hypothetical protein LW808_002485 [Verrucomicrobiota bacterium]